MGIAVTDENISIVKSVVGPGFSDMDIIRSLHLANNDPAAAINIIFDTPHIRLAVNGSASCASATTRKRSPDFTSVAACPDQVLTRVTPDSKTVAATRRRSLDSTSAAGCPAEQGPYAVTPESKGGGALQDSEAPPVDLMVDRSPLSDAMAETSVCSMGSPSSSSSKDDRWWLVGCSELAGLSTCKGRQLKPGDEITFSYSSVDKLTTTSSTIGKFPVRGRSLASCSEIMRFSSKQHGEIGRIPNEWARCLLPLLRANKIKIEGFCKSAPKSLSIMDTVLLSIRVHINSSIFRKNHQPLKTSQLSFDESTVRPLPILFRLLGLSPFQKAEFTPDDFCPKKQPGGTKDSSGASIPVLPSQKWRKLSSGGSTGKDDEDAVSDGDVDSVIGTSDSCELEEMTPPETLQCDLRPYQKQALHWMVQLEKGTGNKEAATTLHPCWDAYRLSDKKGIVVYLNAFSGDATTNFPSMLQVARGGILADAMGLGKTIMTISLLLALPSKGKLYVSPESDVSCEINEVNDLPEQSPNPAKKLKYMSGFSKLFKSKASLLAGGTLIICPMTLLGQWKAEIEAHAKPGSLTVYVHYGQSRSKDVRFLSQSDVVLTTYGVLASDYSTENSEENAGLYALQWYRVVLDEAHNIKSSKSQVSKAASALAADRRWCLTGTPIQNSLEDIYSLLRFLKLEPWSNWGLWYKLIQKPYEEGDERGLKVVQVILRPIMLRRTKSSTDREGRPIIVLPPAHVEVVYCELSTAEKDFYEALFRRSKVKFDQFVEQGRVLHNYASILELLLRLRQCCDHPFLVMSRGDTQEYSDLNKLARRFLRGDKDTAVADSSVVPSRAFVQEVVGELHKGEGECPICLEAFEDAIFTPCAHRMCRECLLTSWRGGSSGLCPVCRKIMNKQDLITAPTDSRFQIDIEKNWVESSKVSVLLQELKKVQSSGAKSIVFSQWTAFLDLLEIPLSRHDFSFLRLDGTLSQQQRENVINKFSDDKNILVLLMSLKAGGVGLNLTAASNAFLMDPWWNPAVEEQAVMRIHRIGQSKSVSIKRFIVKGTVEERLEAVKARKQRMIAGALTDQEVRNARIEELKMLFT